MNEYLSKQKLTPELSSKLIELYESIVKVGYTRHDTSIFHIFVTHSGELKLIITPRKNIKVYLKLIVIRSKG